MTPLAIVAALRDGTATDATWAALDELVWRQVERAVPAAQERDDVAQAVLLKFVEKARRNEVGITGESDEEVRGYVSTMARNGWRSAGRKAQRTPSSDEDAVEAASVPPSAEGELDRERSTRAALDLFDRVAEAAIEAAPPAYRAARRVARRQVEELYFEDLTVDDVVARDEGLGPAALPEELKRAANRAMKQHQRFREAVLAAALDLVGRGVITAAERSVVERVVLELKRR